MTTLKIADTDLKQLPSSMLLIFFLLINLLLRAAFINFNQAEYTDGILQITIFRNPSTYWPPLYALLTMGLKSLIGHEELAARLISLLANVALIIPLYYLSLRLFDKSVGLFSCLLYTVAPIAWRWSVRVMTDSLFAFLFLCAVWFIIRALDRTSQETDHQSEANEKFLVLAVLFSVLATLTRYQGILLLPLNILIIAVFVKRYYRLPLFGILSLLLWLTVAGWIWFRQFGHLQQFAERTAPGFIPTVLSYLNNFESFVLLFPYFITYPVALAFIAGLIYAGYQHAGRRTLLYLFIYLFLAILIIQSAFSSFQSRYLFPLLPMCLVFAGAGLAKIEQALKSRRPWFTIIMFITLAYGLLFSLAVMTMQRGAFADIKQAALFIKQQQIVSPVYSNEYYPPERDRCIKMSYWSERPVKLFTGQALPPGSVICVHSAYGGFANFYFIIQQLTESYDMQYLATYKASLVPLLPEIMQEPFSHQNPLAWVLRYQPQDFSTIIFRIAGEKSPEQHINSP